MLTLIFATGISEAKTSKVNNKTYTHPSFYTTKLHKLFHGVDVSYWQGAINWKKAKKSGIDFAILRCGYTALNNFSMHMDSTFLTNYINAKEAGVSVGLYYYACATSASEARKEANYVISILKNNSITSQLPVVLDYEIDTGRPNSKYNAIVKKFGQAKARRVYTKNAKAFMNQIKAAGYETMFYSYRVMIDPNFSSRYRFNMEDINGSDQYRFWLAQYSNSISYGGKMEIWQFSSTGKVSGMSGNIDRNFWYYPLSGVNTNEGTKNIRKAKITLSKSQVKYDGEIQQPKVTVKYNGKTLKKDKDYAVSYMDNIEKGTATALIHGKGDYSNEDYKTFKIGTKNVSSKSSSSSSDDKSEPTEKAELAKPGAIKNYGTILSPDATVLKFSWDKAENAVRYNVQYKVNGSSKWKSTHVTSNITDLKLNSGDIVAIRVRGQNVSGKTVKNGPWTKSDRRYMKTASIAGGVKPSQKIKVKWGASKDSKGTVSYEVLSTRAGGTMNTLTTKKSAMTLAAGYKQCYSLRVRPVIKVNGKKYAGGISANAANLYVAYEKIRRSEKLNNGFRVYYSKLTDTGNPGYRIYFSRYSSMKKARAEVRSQKNNKCTVTGLKGKAYWCKVEPYKVINGVEYRGLRSEKKRVI